MEPPGEDLAQELHEACVQHALASHAAAAEQWQANPAQLYILTFSGPLEDRPHRLCPSQSASGADCPNCKKPLLHLLSLETAKLPFWSTESPAAIHLLYCWTCAIPYGPFSYRIHQDGRIEVLKCEDGSGEFGSGGPYEGHTGVFPESQVGLRAISQEEQRIAWQLLVGGEGNQEYQYLAEPIHQIGGFPVIGNPIDVQCAACAQAPPFFRHDL